MAEIKQQNENKKKDLKEIKKTSSLGDRIKFYWGVFFKIFMLPFGIASFFGFFGFTGRLLGIYGLL